MTVCGNKLSGVCGACMLVNICRNNEIAKLPKSNIEWMREASWEELAEWIAKNIRDTIKLTNGNTEYTELITSAEWWYRWLKQPHKGGNEKTQI